MDVALGGKDVENRGRFAEVPVSPFNIKNKHEYSLRFRDGTVLIPQKVLWSYLGFDKSTLSLVSA